MYLGCIPVLPLDLCYQEHFTEPMEEVFYTNYSELLQKTKAQLVEKDHASNPLRALPLRDYSWERIITKYDMFFQSTN